MTAMTIREIAGKLVAHCRNGTARAGLDELYDEDAVSVESAAMPGSGSAETRGVAGIKGKHDWWEGAMEVHSSTVEGPFVHGTDHFAVVFGFDATDRHSGERISMREVGIYTVGPKGRIVREEFYADAGT